jgi:hypothetical protein
MAPPLPRHELAQPQTIAWIDARLREAPSLSRYRLAKEVCDHLNWRDPAGRLREMSARKHLLALHRQGRIALPPARRQQPRPRPPPERFPGEPPPSEPPPSEPPPREPPPGEPPPGEPPPGEPPPETPAGPGITGPLAELGPITLQPLAAGTPESRLWNAMMQAHHPQGSGPLCGAQIRYLIVSARHGPIGGLAVSAAAWRLQARDSFLGWTDAERTANLDGVVCNSRFLILPGVQVKHLASHVLGRLARQLPRDWHARTRITPWLMETYVAAPHPGTAYRAANWIEAGLTAGRGRQDRTGKARLGRKRVFLYPLSTRTLNRLCPRRTMPAEGWVRREFGAARLGKSRLGDPRLSARLLHLAGAFFARPQANIPQACGSAAAAKAAYRFFDNKRVTMDALLEPHHQATIERMRRETLVLVAQDTTSLNYTGRPGMQGIGPISSALTGPQGIEMHSALAFRPDGLPLGILDIACWARNPAEFGKRRRCNAKPIEAKESFKWLRALRPVSAAAPACPGTRIVVLADREADIYEYMLEARTLGTDIVLRAKEKYRSVEGEGEIAYLGPQLLMCPRAGTIELAVPRRDRQPARQATLSLRFTEVDLNPPQAKPDLAPIRMWAVLAHEDAPPPGVAALDWMLLTSVPVAGLADAVERLQWYAKRWGIEVFHRVLKSGCQIEDRQLGTAERLEACLAIDAVVAWRIHQLTFLGRATPDLPCTSVFEDDQWKAVMVVNTQRAPPETPPTLREMLRMVAKLGGFLARTRDGEPGTEVLWRGLQRMDDITMAFRCYHAAYARPP